MPRSFRKNTELPKETYTFIGKREIWKTEIEEVMDNLKKSENELVKREVLLFSSPFPRFHFPPSLLTPPPPPPFIHSPSRLL